MIYNKNMDTKDLKQALDNMWEDVDHEEFMNYEPSIYDLYVNVEEGICLYKNNTIHLGKSSLEYLKILINNTKKGKYTLSRELEDKLKMSLKSADKLKERINKEFKNFPFFVDDNKESKDLDLIVNTKSYGNKINSKFKLISAC